MTAASDLPPPPTRQEILELYPSAITWEELKAIVEVGDLEQLLRHPDMERRYQEWCAKAAENYGSVGNYILKVRLGWDGPTVSPSLPVGTPQYFTSDIPSHFFRTLNNEWPYLMPCDIEHFTVWTRVPILHPATIPREVSDYVEYNGLFGFTGGSMRVRPRGSLSPDKMKLVEIAGSQIAKFVQMHWKESEWETAWTYTPPRIQSVNSLDHFHILARRKGVDRKLS